MDESLLTAAEKEVLVALVKIVQKQKLKGRKGGWTEFLIDHDRQLGSSICDPAKRSIDDLVTFFKTFSDEEDLKFLTKMLHDLSVRKSAANSSKTSQVDESPQQRLVRQTLQHPDYLLNYSFLSKNEEWAATKPGKDLKAARSNSMVAVDCEMVLCEDDTEALVQVCVVDQNLDVKLNERINPNKAVANYRTEITGISAEDLEGVTCSLAYIQKKMKKLLRHGTILVGHSLSNDLKALKLDHVRVIDTSYIFETPTGRRPSLNDLCKAVLGYEVRKDGAPHNCPEDARAAMKLVLAKLDNGYDGTSTWVGKDVPESSSAKLLLHGIPSSVPKEELWRVFPDFTFDIEPRSNARTPKNMYSVIAVFKDSREAHMAFESIKTKEEKDSSGLPQKFVLLLLCTGLPATFYVRKSPPDRPTISKKPTVEEKKDDGPIDKLSSKKRVAEVENNEVKKLKLDSSGCEHDGEEIKCEPSARGSRKSGLWGRLDDTKEVGRLKRKLQQKDDEITSLHKIIAALTRKQGL